MSISAESQAPALRVREHSARLVWVALALVALLFGTAFSTSGAPSAHADDLVQQIDRLTLAQRNPLMVMSGATMQQQLGKTPAAASVKSTSGPACSVTRLDSAYDGELTYNAQRRNIEAYRGGTMQSLALECPTGLLLEFRDVASAGAPAPTATIRYPLVGTFDGSAVGAVATYTFHWREMAGDVLPHDYPWIAVQVSDSLFGGLDMCNVESVEVSLYFYDCESGDVVETGDDTYFTIGSLSWFKDNSYEWVSAKKNVTTRIDIPKTDDATDGHLTVLDEGPAFRIAPTIRGDWEDNIKSANFYKHSASLYQSGSLLEFTVGNTLTSQMWWSFATASIATPSPVDPTKQVDREAARVGDALHYTISQTVNTAGVDIQSKYRSFKFEDALPAEVDYTAGSARLMKVAAEGGKESDITEQACTIEYDAKQHTLACTMKSAYLQTMDMAGETYRLEFDALVNESAVTDEEVENSATVTINDHAGSCLAETIISAPESAQEEASLSIEKTSDPATGSTVEPGQSISYTLKVTNVGKAAASNVAVFDRIPDATTFQSVGDTGNAIVSDDRLSIGWTVASLEPGESMALRFTVQVAADTKEGTVITNRASCAPNFIGTPKDDLETPSNQVVHTVAAKPTTDEEKEVVEEGDDGSTQSGTGAGIANGSSGTGSGGSGTKGASSSTKTGDDLAGAAGFAGLLLIGGACAAVTAWRKRNPKPAYRIYRS